MVLLDGNQALLGMDNTEVFTSWMANSKTEIQSVHRQLATASSEPEIGGLSASNGYFWVCRKVLQEAFLSTSQRGSHCSPFPGLPMRHQLRAMGRATRRHLLFRQRQKNQHPDSSCCIKTQQHITTCQLLHTGMQDAALPSKSPKSAVTKVIARVSLGI